jgi:hypothetical protein
MVVEKKIIKKDLIAILVKEGESVKILYFQKKNKNVIHVRDSDLL